MTNLIYTSSKVLAFILYSIIPISFCRLSISLNNCSYADEFPGREINNS